MAKAKSSKPRVKNALYYGFNIKLLSEERKGDNIYSEIIQQVFEKGIKIDVTPEKRMTIRNQFQSEYSFKGTKYKILFGKLARYTKIDGKQWYNETTKEYTEPELPKDSFPSGFDADYVFIPAIHKFFVAVNAKVGVGLIYSFLIKSIPQVIGIKEDLVVNVMQSQNKIDEIINASELKYLDVSVTYTNDDAGDKAQESIDKLLKSNYVGKFDAQIRPDIHGRLNTNEEFIRGLLELAKDNGEATAGIINEDGKRDKIITSQFPEKIAVKVEPNDEAKQKLFTSMMEKYKDDGAGKQ